MSEHPCNEELREKIVQLLEATAAKHPTKQYMTDDEQQAGCEYFVRLQEALEHGEIVDENVFDDPNKALPYLVGAAYVLVHNSAWACIASMNHWAYLLDPITRYDLVLDGSVGALANCRVYTDAFLPPHLKDHSPETQGKVIFVPHHAAKHDVPETTPVQEEIANSEYFKRLPEAMTHGVQLDVELIETEPAYVMGFACKSKYVLVHADAWSSILGSDLFATMLDPITKSDILSQAKLGTVIGCELYSDAFHSPEAKDTTGLPRGKMVFVIRDEFKHLWNAELKQFVI